jgi:hypothetical protein
MLAQKFQLLRQLAIAAFDQACEDQYQQLCVLHHPSIKAQDLKIPATALVNQLTLVTANRSDFASISGIVLDDGLILATQAGLARPMGYLSPLLTWDVCPAACYDHNIPDGPCVSAPLRCLHGRPIAIG